MSLFSSSSSSSIICPKLDLPESPHVEVADLCLGSFFSLFLFDFFVSLTSFLFFELWLLGWFWGPDAQFSEMIGVVDVTVGYTGGLGAYPTYRKIKDHTEGVRVVYDPNIVTYEEILESYFDQLGDGIYYPSYGVQYRSVILVHSEEQREIATRFILLKSTNGRKVYVDIENANDFYKAEEYHQKYYIKSKSY